MMCQLRFSSEDEIANSCDSRPCLDVNRGDTGIRKDQYYSASPTGSLPEVR